MARNPLDGKAAIIGMGQTRFSKDLGVLESQVALEAISSAVADAGLRMQDIDGIVRYDMDSNWESTLASTLAIPNLRFFATAPFGGAAGCNTVQLAMLAVATGQATNVVAFRARCRGKAAAAREAQAGRPWEKVGMRLADAQQYHVPFGLATPAAQVALLTRRYLLDFGYDTRHLGMVSVTQRKHASSNPNAVMRTPITLEDHQSSRWVAEPLRLLDCCLETDGGCAVVVTSGERAKDAKQRPVYIMAAAQGTNPYPVPMTNYYRPNLYENESKACARDLFARAGISPRDMDAAMIYDAFSVQILMGLEDYGFCKPGEAGAFVMEGRIEGPHGDLPVNTHGGGLSEAYIHGFNHILEGVRQIRGTSSCQVPDCEMVLVCSASLNPTSALILRR